jgi:hypothetical protein
MVEHWYVDRPLSQESKKLEFASNGLCSSRYSSQNGQMSTLVDCEI